MVVASPPEPPLAASLVQVPVPVADLHMEVVRGEGCACGPSGSRRKFDYYQCGPPPEVNASLVVWWWEAAGTGEAVTTAL